MSPLFLVMQGVGAAAYARLQLPPRETRRWPRICSRVGGGGITGDVKPLGTLNWDRKLDIASTLHVPGNVGNETSGYG